MKVELRSVTQLAPDIPEWLEDETWIDSPFAQRVNDDFWFDRWSAADTLAEAAGRLCYDSYDLPRKETATNEGYLANIQRQMHRSVLGHSSFTFLISGVSRALTHELVRHSHFRFSQESQRYIDEAQRPSTAVVPPLLYELRDTLMPTAEGGVEVQAVIDEYLNHAVESLKVYRRIQAVMRKHGHTKKAANDAARYALPQGWETKLFVTGNGQAWLEFLEKRENPHAAREIELLARRIAVALRTEAPATFPRGEASE